MSRIRILFTLILVNITTLMKLVRNAVIFAQESLALVEMTNFLPKTA